MRGNLKNKVDALFIDREECMGMRRSFPFNNTIKYLLDHLFRLNQKVLNVELRNKITEFFRCTNERAYLDFNEVYYFFFLHIPLEMIEYNQY